MSVIERIAYVDGGIVSPPAPVEVLPLTSDAAEKFFADNGYMEVEPSAWEQGGVYAAIPAGKVAEIQADRNKNLFDAPSGAVEAVAVVRHHTSHRGEFGLHAQYFPGTKITPSESARPALAHAVIGLAGKLGTRVVVEL